MDTLDIALRLGAATLVGVVLGLNRDLHGKSTGVRTLGVLCLGSALAGAMSKSTKSGSSDYRAAVPRHPLGPPRRPVFAREARHPAGYAVALL